MYDRVSKIVGYASALIVTLAMVTFATWAAQGLASEFGKAVGFWPIFAGLVFIPAAIRRV